MLDLIDLRYLGTDIHADEVLMPGLLSMAIKQRGNVGEMHKASSTYKCGTLPDER